MVGGGASARALGRHVSVAWAVDAVQHSGPGYNTARVGEKAVRKKGPLMTEVCFDPAATQGWLCPAEGTNGARAVAKLCH